MAGEAAAAGWGHRAGDRHRLSTIQNAVVLEGGADRRAGTHEELLEAVGAYAALYRDWAGQAA